MFTTNKQINLGSKTEFVFLLHGYIKIGKRHQSLQETDNTNQKDG